MRLKGQDDKLPGQLSGGQQQRVAIARAIVIEPPLVLMDEPLSNLDAKLRLEMRAEIRRIHNTLGSTTIYVTHDQDEALSLADRIVVLRDGEMRQVGTPEDLYRAARLISTSPSSWASATASPARVAVGRTARAAVDVGRRRASRASPRRPCSRATRPSSRSGPTISTPCADGAGLAATVDVGRVSAAATSSASARTRRRHRARLPLRRAGSTSGETVRLGADPRPRAGLCGSRA